MRAIVVPRLGGPEVLTLRELPDPVCGPDQVVVRIKYAGVTFGDVYVREGTYRGGKPLLETDPPLPIGGEGAGTVTAIGANVKHVKVGDTVVYCETIGSYAEALAVPAWRVVKVPEGIDLLDAAAIYSHGMTAHYLAHDVGKLGPGKSCLIHAAAGGVGHILLQLAKGLGAKVLGTVGSREKGDFITSLGADLAIYYREQPFLEAVKAWGDGKGVDVVYDSVGQATLADSIKATRPHGLCVLYGNTSGLVDAISPMDLAAAGSIFFTRPRLAHHVTSQEQIAARAKDLFDGLARGTLKVKLNKVFPLAEAAAAHELLGSRATTGKILLQAD